MKQKDPLETHKTGKHYPKTENQGEKYEKIGVNTREKMGERMEKRE